MKYNIFLFLSCHRKRSIEWIVMALFLCFSVAVSVSCTNEKKERVKDASSPQGRRPLKVSVSTGYIYDLVHNVTQGKVEIYQIINTGLDPHTYTPTRSDIVEIYFSDIIFYNGLHLEGGLYNVFNRLKSKRNVHAISDMLKEESYLEEGNAFDPHIWLDVSLWRQATLGVGEAMALLDPENAQEYIQNSRAYAQSLQTLDATIRTMFSTIPQSQKVLVTSHDAFGYFGKAYSFQVFGIQGISTVAEASLLHIHNLINVIIDNNIGAVFVETSVSDKYVHALIEGAESKQHAVKKGGKLYTDSMGRKGSGADTYMGVIMHNARTITRALRGESVSTP